MFVKIVNKIFSDDLLILIINLIKYYGYDLVILLFKMILFFVKNDFLEVNLFILDLNNEWFSNVIIVM